MKMLPPLIVVVLLLGCAGRTVRVEQDTPENAMRTFLLSIENKDRSAFRECFDYTKEQAKIVDAAFDLFTAAFELRDEMARISGQKPQSVDSLLSGMPYGADTKDLVYKDGKWKAPMKLRAKNPDAAAKVLKEGAGMFREFARHLRSGMELEKAASLMQKRMLKFSELAAEAGFEQ